MPLTSELTPSHQVQLWLALSSLLPLAPRPLLVCSLGVLPRLLSHTLQLAPRPLLLLSPVLHTGHLRRLHDNIKVIR